MKFLTLLILVSGITAFATENILNDGDFEKNSTGGTQAKNTGAKYEYDKKTFKTGKRSLKLSTQSGWIYRAHSILVKPDTEYEISGWVKSDKAGKYIIRMIRFYSNEKYILGGEFSALKGQGTKDWTSFSFLFNSKKAARINLRYYLYNKGVVWFDGISVKEIKK